MSANAGDFEGESLDYYLAELPKYDMLSEEDVIRLARKGDKKSLDKIVEANLRFVIFIAKKYRNRGISLSDLVAEGNVGLITASRRFDPEINVKFTSYAVWWVRQCILSLIARQGRSVNIPVNRSTDIMRISREEAKLRQELNRDPTLEEISEATEITPENVSMLKSKTVPAFRLDAPLSLEDSDASAHSILIDENTEDPIDTVDTDKKRNIVNLVMTDLGYQDSMVVRMYFGLQGNRKYTLEEIGNFMGVSRERVRQVRDRAMRRIRHGKHSKTLKEMAKV